MYNVQCTYINSVINYKIAKYVYHHIKLIVNYKLTFLVAPAAVNEGICAPPSPLLAGDRVGLW